ncbi:bifunctional folylpolyglutamate synthase/dihydrofolate synthase [Hymenobacter busanensis]|uniref:Dihydrofolate synthase/folylpolyglutamate synthase n=1 Tax=Hymenobacter busanensis TaxID=2607656 RepID=A0A7L4ZSU2_9BACT|nr:folylpolyglutamate synthase/dihydrofolate synthase family protein [Hymenobacter busanensis]KAA9339838.1 bifunctional folylpolyglutamate synthase/dihydrofolate synthase [Hymenobacter busanensis]QHJ06409.1 bifunctional folylpolyglutamate synthase/dihydrofolate synthase [Hymenobacter busanensis]
MTYAETLAFLYGQLPMFQRVGAAGFKDGLVGVQKLVEAMGHPERRFQAVHVAGTNGKGSSSHLLAAVLQAAGYKTGLYTSPHLREFTERIRLNGQELTPEYLVAWVAKWRGLFEQVQPSFFEMCVALAYDYFAAEQVDVAVVEVGLGGRLDSTNIITPLVSLITNISYDHQAILGDTLPLIAREKAGIIKPGVPAVVSQRQGEVEAVFTDTAAQQGAPLQFAEDRYRAELLRDNPAAASQHLRLWRDGAVWLDDVELGLVGDYQRLNLPGVLAVVEELRQQGFSISDEHLRTGLRDVRRLTGLRGRWQIVGRRPLVVCDTGHNEAGIRMVLGQLARLEYQRLHLVLGVVNDKDPETVLRLLPAAATYYFCQANIPRALPAGELQQRAAAEGLVGEAYGPVAAALAAARQHAGPDDVIFVGGSTFVVAEVPDLYDAEQDSAG